MDRRFTIEEWDTCMRVLEALKEDPFNNPDNQRSKTLFSQIYKKVKKSNRSQLKKQHNEEDLSILNNASVAKEALQFEHKEITPNKEVVQIILNRERKCYACLTPYKEVHFYYHRLCPICAEEHYRNRDIYVDLTNRNVIITGGRVKVGYAAALKFLRSNANVMVTTRFPGLALEQFQKEEDSANWIHRLKVYGLDLRNLRQIDEFISYFKKSYSHVDVLVNNAAQTIKYTDAYYEPLIAKEQQLVLVSNTDQLIANTTPIADRELPLLEGGLAHKEMALNRFGQPIDYREKNSWNTTLEEVDLRELVEVNLINQIAPFHLIANLKSHFAKSPYPYKNIVNVTSVEGQFSYANKTKFHPHTNMTKAALNMMTRTSAQEFVDDDIYMNSVDVGWISTGAHEEKRKRLFEMGKVPPLDSTDGGARIYQPIVLAASGKPVYGKLFKNFKEVDW